MVDVPVPSAFRKVSDISANFTLKHAPIGDSGSDRSDVGHTSPYPLVQCDFAYLLCLFFALASRTARVFTRSETKGRSRITKCPTAVSRAGTNMFQAMSARISNSHPPLRVWSNLELDGDHSRFAVESGMNEGRKKAGQ